MSCGTRVGRSALRRLLEDADTTSSWPPGRGSPSLCVFPVRQI